MIDWLMGTMLATAALMALVLLIRRPVARLFGARIAYALWLIPAARLFMPSLTETIEVPVRDAAPSALSPETLAAIAAAQAEPAAFDWTALALTIWIGGAAMLFLWRSWSYIQQREDILAEAKPVEVIDGIRIVEAPAVAGPIAFGLFDKVVALPSSFFRNYSERERELALAHEISHHRSGDLFVNLAAFGLLCIHWFNPLAWIAWRAFRFDQEAACDARVLGASRADDRPVYGRAIAKAASGRPLIFASALDNKKLLKQRLRTMNFNDKSPIRRKAGLILVAAGIAVALPLTASVSYAYVQAPEAPAAPEAPRAPDAPDAPAYPDADLDYDGDMRRIVIRDEDGEHRVHIDREELRRSLDEIPTREELRAMVERDIPSRAELEAMIARDIPSREELRAMIPDIDVEERCDGSGEPVVSEVRAGGSGRAERIRIAICAEGLRETALSGARSGLDAARRAIAVDEDISAEDRREALAEIDAEIARLDAELGR